MKEITLSRGKVALIDDEDFELISQHKWHTQPVGKTFYALTNIKKDPKNWRKGFIHIRMHRLIMGLSISSLEVDHIDHNGLNNQRGNLRIVNRAQNTRNRRANSKGTSAYKGVSYHKHKHKHLWLSAIHINNRQKKIGFFKTEIEAAIAYDQEAKIAYGEYAYLNFK